MGFVGGKFKEIHKILLGEEFGGVGGMGQVPFEFIADAIALKLEVNRDEKLAGKAGGISKVAEAGEVVGLHEPPDFDFLADGEDNRINCI